MTGALLEAPLSVRAEGPAVRPAGGRPMTLEERLAATWRTVQAGGKAECPVCRSTMRPENGAGRCTGCGSTLS
jgi:hypothetical protein